MTESVQPIRFLVGAGPSGVGTTPPADPGQQNPPTDPSVSTPPPSDPPTSSPNPAQDDWASMFDGMTPADVRKALDDSRKWESRSKENFAKAQQFDALAELVSGDGAPPDPAKLTEDLTAAQHQTRQTRIENAVLRAAGKHGASPDALTDSRSFMAQVADLDPSGTDFAARIDDAITAAMKTNPAIKTASAPAATADPYLRHPSSLKTSSRDLGAAEAQRRFGAPKT